MVEVFEAVPATAWARKYIQARLDASERWNGIKAFNRYQKLPTFVVVNRIGGPGMRDELDPVDIVSFEITAASEDPDDAEALANFLRHAMLAAPAFDTRCQWAEETDAPDDTTDPDTDLVEFSFTQQHWLRARVETID